MNSIQGTPANETLIGTPGEDSIDGDGGDDILYGDGGDDVLLGGAGNDLLAGQWDSDVLTGGPGLDQFNIGLGDGGTERITDYEYGEKLFVYGAPNELEQYRLRFDGFDTYLDIDIDAADDFDFFIILSGPVMGLITHTEETSGSEIYDAITIASANAVYGGQFDDTMSSSGAAPVTMFGLRGNDLIIGGTANDTIHGGSGDDELYGNRGSDAVLGGAGDDLLAGQWDADVLTGGPGLDQFNIGLADGGTERITDYEYGEKLFLYGAPNQLEQYRLRVDGIDTYLDIDVNGVGDFDQSIILSGSVKGLLTRTEETSGGAVYDVINIAPANAVYASQFDDTLIDNGATSVTLFGLRGNDLLSGSTANDVVYGGSGNDDLYGNFGSDTIVGGDGNDMLAGQYDSDVLTGGAGLDEFNIGMGDGGTDRITDYAYGEKLFLYGSPNDLEQYRLRSDGTDSYLDIDTDGVGDFDSSIILSGSIAGLLTHTEGTSRGADIYDVITIASANALYGGQFDDQLVYGGVDSVFLFGLRGNDSIQAGSGNDTLAGGSGNDTLAGGAGADILNGGLGLDTADYSTAPGEARTARGVRVNLANGRAELSDAQNDQLIGIENLTGSAYNDTLTGNAGINLLRGGAGNDMLAGGAGADIIHGGAGNDVLSGGAAGTADGTGDTFVFDTALNAATNVDSLSAFEASALDKIALDPALFAAVTGGGTTGLDATEFRSGNGNAMDANDFILYDRSTGRLYYDADGSGSGARILFAQFTGLIGVLDAADFTTILPSSTWIF